MKMKLCRGWIATFILGCCMQAVNSSYLGYPRIHFAGQFRADSNTRNNDFCNYRLDKPTNPDLNGMDWNANGTNEFQFVHTKVTSVLYKDGTSSTTDPLVGQNIIGNLKRPIAKIVDINNSGAHMSIFGMKFGIQWVKDFPTSNDPDLGTWKRSILHFWWPRMKCYSKTHHGSQLYQDSFGYYAAQGQSQIIHIDWPNTGKSKILEQLQDMYNGTLTVRISVFYHTENYLPYVARNATIGYVIGAIGLTSQFDTVSVPGERGMFHKDNPVGLTFDNNDLCYNQDLSKFGNWMNYVPFEVDANEVRIDLSNSVPADISNSLRDIGTLRLGILMDNCVIPLGDDSGLPYASNNDLPLTSGIYAVCVNSIQMGMVAEHPLVIAQMLPSNQGTVAVCGENVFSVELEHTAQILQQEYPYFVRPTGYYAHFLERDSTPTGEQTLLVTKYGKPSQDMELNVITLKESFTQGGGCIIPEDGVILIEQSALKNEFQC